MRAGWRYAIGLGVPLVAIVPTVPVLARLDAAPLGVPIAVLWLFGCIPLTACCLAVCWVVHDRHQPADDVPPTPPG